MNLEQKVRSVAEFLGYLPSINKTSEGFVVQLRRKEDLSLDEFFVPQYGKITFSHHSGKVMKIEVWDQWDRIRDLEYYLL